MKKLIALLLALLMVSSAVIAVSAEETGEAVPTAPTIFAQTEPVIDKGEDEESAEDDTIVAYNVRFLAAVHETTGDAIGFEVVAKYSGKEDAYSKAEGDTAMEGTTIYKKVMVEGESKPVTNYDADAIGMFAAGINGVPTNLDIVFEIKAYITYGESEKVETGVVTAQYANGKILSMTGADVYTQDFNAATSNTALLTAAGITQPYGKAMVPTLAGDKLNIPKTGWGSKDCMIGLVGNSVFSGETDEYDYMFEMDVNFTELSVFTLIFNGDADTVYNAKNSLLVSLRLMSGCDSTSKGTISSQSKNDAYNLWLRHGGYNSTNGTVKTFGTDTANQNNGYEDVLAYNITDGAASAAVKLTVVVNNTYTDGCQVEVYIDGVSKYSFVAPEAYDVSSASNILLWAQDTAMSIDNIKVNKITDSITSGTIPTDVTPMYEQGFDATNYENSLEGVGVGHSYVNSTCPTCGLPLTINDAKQLQISSHAWHNTPDYFANVVPATGVNGADLYKFEAYVSITSASNFGFTLNNKHNAQKTDAYQYLSNFLFVKFIKDGDNLKSLHITEADAAGGTGNTVTKTEYALTSTVSAKDGFKFSVIVDSTDENACVLYLFINDELVAVHTTAGNDWDVADVSTIGVFAQDTVATIDNIKFTGVKKN